MSKYRAVKGGIESGVQVFRIQQRSFCIFKNIKNWFLNQPLESYWKFVTCPYYGDAVEFTSKESAVRFLKELKINNESNSWTWVPVDADSKNKQYDLF